MAAKKGPAHALDEVRACAVRRAVEFMESSAKTPLRNHFGSNRVGLAAACQALSVDIEPPYDDATVCVSFHPPRFPMTTIAGRKVTT